MATFRAIAATSQAILGLLSSAAPRPEMSGATFALYQASDFQKPMDEGISLFLYHISAGIGNRNSAPRLAPDGRRYRPSLPLDLHYLLTPWAKTAQLQQRLLGWAIRTLEDTPILPAGLLNHFVSEAETFHDSETVELIFAPMSIQDETNIWEMSPSFRQVSVAYVARMVMIESDLEMVEGALVQARDFALAGRSTGSGKGPAQ